MIRAKRCRGVIHDSMQGAIKDYLSESHYDETSLFSAANAFFAKNAIEYYESTHAHQWFVLPEMSLPAYVAYKGVTHAPEIKEVKEGLTAIIKGERNNLLSFIGDELTSAKARHNFKKACQFIPCVSEEFRLVNQPKHTTIGCAGHNDKGKFFSRSLEVLVSVPQTEYALGIDLNARNTPQFAAKRTIFNNVLMGHEKENRARNTARREREAMERENQAKIEAEAIANKPPSAIDRLQNLFKR